MANKKRKKHKYAARKDKGIPGQKNSPQTIAISEAVNLALHHHQAGQLNQAEQIYRQILQSDPDNAIVNHFLGVIAYQVGKHDIAIQLISKALSVKPNYAEAHSNLGNALKEQGNLEDAVASHQKAISLKPDFAEAHNNLGITLNGQGNFKNAVASYNRAISIRPNYAEAYYNLGVTFQEQGNFKEAVASYQKAISLKPDFAEAHNNLGVTFQEQGSFEEAVASYQKAIFLKSDYAEAYINLAEVMNGVSVNPDAIIFLQLKDTLTALLLRDDIGHQNLVIAALSILLTPDVRISIDACISTSVECNGSNLFADKNINELITNPMLLLLLKKTIIHNSIVELFLTKIRKSLLFYLILNPDANKNSAGIEKIVYGLSCQWELDQIDQLHNTIKKKIADNSHDIDLYVALLGCYMPLYSVDYVVQWIRQVNYDSLKEFSQLISIQVKEPCQEQKILHQIKRLTPITDDISQKVMLQYRENPYPRWINISPRKPKSFASQFRTQIFPNTQTATPNLSAPDILVAGCGTGKQPIATIAALI